MTTPAQAYLPSLFRRQPNQCLDRLRDRCRILRRNGQPRPSLRHRVGRRIDRDHEGRARPPYSQTACWADSPAIKPAIVQRQDENMASVLTSLTLTFGTGAPKRTIARVLPFAPVESDPACSDLAHQAPCGKHCRKHSERDQLRPAGPCFPEGYYDAHPLSQPSLST